MNVDRFLTLLSQYPLTFLCLSDYIQWLGDAPTIDLKNNDLISTLEREDIESLKKLEILLNRTREIVALSETDFKNVFGFSKDLLTTDPDKIHDVLAEPLIVVALADHGFERIRKLPRFIKNEGLRIAVADFVGERLGKKYAIELKTTRMENKPRPEPGKPTGNAMIPSWWRNMFRNNIITKIEDKNRKALSQLGNTKKHFDCDYAMLALYTRRLGPSTLMATEDYMAELAAVKNLYDEIDYIFFKDYFGQVVVCPQLST